MTFSFSFNNKNNKTTDSSILKRNTLFSIDKIERQANAFAVELLLPDKFLDEYSDINFATVAKSNGIPEVLE